MKHRPMIDLPIHAWRALHSGFTDWLVLAPREVSEAVVQRLGGQMNFQHWMLAIHMHRRLDVYARVDESDQAHVGISVPVTSGNDWLLFDMTGKEAGVDPDWLMTAARLRMEEELRDILKEQPR